MSRRRTGRLTEEERILWNKVASTAVPLAGKTLDAADTPAVPVVTGGQGRESGQPSVSTAAITAAADRPQPSSPRRLDAPVRTKIARGRVAIDASVDLHGMTQQEAYGLLLSFLGRAQANGLRHVLVITGKGTSSSGDGVLRRSAPQWFATAPFRLIVSGYDEAGRRHGGGGALYVRLRRLRG